jgi:glycolate oxidase FAD binding subunit
VNSATEPLPLRETCEPVDPAALREVVERAARTRTPVYPIGGATALDYGLTPKSSGIGLSLTRLNRVMEYPARDMTITVEAGITMQALAETLAAERQQIPLDVPDPQRATLGGVIATNWSGPRRAACGTIRDYVIGISAVDGQGMLYHGGGRVVKNVAGYDFCKLLVGSLGTLGVITQATLKLKPLPERSVGLLCGLRNWAEAESLLAATVASQVTPAAVELLAGPAWTGDPALGALPPDRCAAAMVLLEGTSMEVDWLVAEQRAEWQRLGFAPPLLLDADLAAFLRRVNQFPADRSGPLVLKFVVRPRHLIRLIAAVAAIDPRGSFEAHAVNGVLIARFADFPTAEVGRLLPGTLQPLARSLGGHCVVLSWSGGELTRQAWWGAVDSAGPWMRAVQERFDPHQILNPGRFVAG